MPLAALLPGTDVASGIRQLRAAFLKGAKPDPEALVAALGTALGARAFLRTRPQTVQQPGTAVLTVPVVSGSRWLGDLVVQRDVPFSPEEEMLAEATAALAGAVLASDQARAEDADHHRRFAAHAAAASLSLTERRAVRRLLSEWHGRPVTVRLKDAAADAGVHHSSLVQALARLRAAGVVMAGSRGRRGVRLHVLNPLLIEELED